VARDGARYACGMKHDDKLDDIRAWIEPPSPDDVPEDGYDEWVEKDIAQGLADAEAGRLTPLNEVKKEFGIE
jgi:predicted transcriptional regulator